MSRKWEYHVETKDYILRKIIRLSNLRDTIKVLVLKHPDKNLKSIRWSTPITTLVIEHALTNVKELKDVISITIK